MEKRDNSGSLFTNDKKQKDTHPDMNGKITVNGREYYLSAWKKQSNQGKGYLSLSIKAVDEQNTNAPSNDISDFLNSF